MGRRGPCPQPSAVTRLHGGRVRNKFEPKAKGGEPVMPAGMGEAAQGTWGEIVAAMRAVPGLLAKSDPHAIEMAARLMAMWRESAAHVAEHGGIITVRDEKGVVKFTQPSPQASLVVKLAPQLKNLLAELGLTPSARSRLNLPIQPKDEDDPFTRWMRGAYGSVVAKDRHDPIERVLDDSDDEQDEVQ